MGTALLRGVAAYNGELVAWSHGDHPAAARLATAYGWERVRDLWVMRRPTSLPLPPLELPDGLTIRSYVDSDADAIVAVNAAAFAHHPEQGAMDRDNLARRMAEPWFDPAGLLVAEDGSGVLGFHWTKQHDERLGEVYVVGVSPQAQGRGLGRLLTLAGLHHLAGLGVEEVLLYVESDNGPAVAVYSRLGFAHADADTHVQYRRAPGYRSATRSSGQRSGRTWRPTSGSTMTSCAAGISSTVSAASTGTLRLTSASAIGPSSWWRALEPTKPTSRPS